MFFVLRFAVWTVLAETMTMAHTIPERAMKPPSLSERDTDDLFAPESEDALFQDPDPLYSSDSVNVAIQPFDQASTAMCDGTQSSLDLFLDSPTSLDARDLANEIPGFQDFIAPLNKLQDSTCSAPNTPKSGNSNSNSGGPNPPNGGNQQGSDLAPLLNSERIKTKLRDDGSCYLGFAGPGYSIALCCNGMREGINVHGCDRLSGNPACWIVDQQYCCRAYIFADRLGYDCMGVDWDMPEFMRRGPRAIRLPFPGSPAFIEDTNFHFR